MRRSALLFAGIALIANTAFSGEGNVQRKAKGIPGRYIVVLEASADATAVANSVRNLKGARVKHAYKKGLKGLSVEMTDADAQALAKDVRVQFVEEDSVISAATASWGLDRIDQHFLPLNGSFVSGGTGAGVTVYVVDTGVSPTHREFAGRLSAGFSALEDGLGSNDCNGHGTHVAGIIGGSDYGVAKSVNFVPVRVLDCGGSGNLSTLLAGLEFIFADQETAPRRAVVNMSLGGEPSSSLDSVVNRLVASGLATVVAAGNTNQDACKVSPARVRGAITVGASTEFDQRAPFSNFGSCIDVFAPGVNILSAGYFSPTGTATSSGTSAAAPFAAGVAALVLERYPTASAAAVAQTLASQSTPDVLTNVGEGSPNRLLFSTIGSLDESSQSDGQLLADPSFEYGDTFWTSDVCSPSNPAGCISYEDDNGGFSAPDFAGSKYSRSGKGHVAIGGKATTFHLVSETVIIPATIRRAELSFYLWIETKGKKPSADDTLTVEIRDKNGALLETLGKYSNLDACQTYLKRTFDVSRYRGSSIRISFTGVEGKGASTWFLIDDAALNIWR